LRRRALAAAPMATPEEWYRSLPPVTRGYMTSAVAATLTVQLGLLDPSLMHLDFPSIFGSLELWRLLTNFTFFGTFSFPFVMSLFFLIRYTKELEAKRFEGRTADFLWAMAIMGAVQAVVAYVLGGLPFLSQAMLSAIVYVWSREFADTVLSVFGLFNVQGFYWPWVLVALRVLMGGSPVLDLVGILSGHIYYFLEDVQGYSLRAPALLSDFFDRGRPGPAAAQAQRRNMFGNHNWGGGGQRLGG